MANHGVAVATPSNDTSEERPDRSPAEQLVDRARADGKDLVGPGGLLSELTKQVLETGLEVEMEEHLGYPKHAAEGRNHGNSRNGTRSTTVITEIGPVELDMPRDRDGSFEPETVRKNQRRLDGVDSMVISLTAKGLTTWPLAIVPTCVLHLIRNTFRLASRKDWDRMARDLRPVYTAVNEADTAARLDEFHTIWGN